MQLIKVKYVGKGDSVLTEYNGKKYSFGKSNSVQTIPVEVYNFMQDFQSPFREDIVPFSDFSEEVKEEKKKSILDEVAEIEKDLKKEAPHESKKVSGKRK